MQIKPTWDEYFINMLDAVSKRASCDRGRSAAILTKRNRIISTGYVGAPTGLPSCDEVDHLMIKHTDLITELSSYHCIRTFHAEMNAILGCAREGVSTIDSTLYCSMVPCHTCAMAIIQAGIIRVVAINRYQSDEDTLKMFKATDIVLDIINEMLSYVP